MNSQTSPVGEFRRALNACAARYGVALDAVIVSRLSDYYALLLTWNPRLHLVAPCSSQEFATRHVLESLLLSAHLPANARVADVGSGAGLPIIPNLIARPDLQATLVEASQKKSVFLKEALRVTKSGGQAKVVAARFEDLPQPMVDIVTCRALDRFTELLPALIDWAPPRSRLLAFGGPGLQKQITATNLEFAAIKIPDTERRFLFVVEKI